MPALAARRRLSVAIPLLIVTALLLSVAFAPHADARSRRHHKINHAVNVAINQIGDHYRYGAAGPRRFDCSGLIYFAYHKRTNLWMPRSSAAQYRRVRHIHKRHLRHGDLVFFHNRSGHVYHVGIYMYTNRHGRRVILHSPRPGLRVHRQKIWTRSWYAGTLRPRR
ncbi:MAG: C40 family peptidase [Nocardioidaceae bacterium]